MNELARHVPGQMQISQDASGSAAMAKMRLAVSLELTALEELLGVPGQDGQDRFLNLLAFLQ